VEAIEGCSTTIRAMVHSALESLRTSVPSSCRATDSHWKPLVCGNSSPFSSESNLDPSPVAWTGSFGRRCGAYIPAGLML